VPDFLKRLIDFQGEPIVRRPEGKRSVMGTVKLPHGKTFAIVREDILQKGLARRKGREAA
jgi:hypothetical protein